MTSNSFLRIAAATLLTAATAIGVSALPHITWIKSSHNFGAFNEDLGEVSFTFKGVNDGDEKLVIFDVRPNCGCVVTDRYAGREYEPGDTIDIKVNYHATGRPGRFNKRIQVQSNADPSKQVLVITGTVIGSDNTVKSRYPVDAGPIKMHTQTSIIGDILKGNSGGAYIKCYNSSSNTVRPEVVSKPKYLSAIVEPKVVPPGEMFVISLNYFSGQCPEWGLVSDTILVRPDINSDMTVPVAVNATIKENFRKMTEEQLAAAPVIEFEPKSIDLGRLPRNASPIKRELTVRNTGKSELILRRVWSPDPTLTIECPNDKIKPGKTAKIRVTVDPAKSTSTEIINARITVISNTPDSPTNIIRVTGEFTD